MQIGEIYKHNAHGTEVKIVEFDHFKVTVKTLNDDDDRDGWLPMSLFHTILGPFELI